MWSNPITLILFQATMLEASTTNEMLIEKLEEDKRVLEAIVSTKEAPRDLTLTLLTLTLIGRVDQRGS